MASLSYCSNAAVELKFLSEKLHKLSSEIDHVPSINKYKVFPQVQDLHIIMTELDDRICDLMTSCHSVEGPYEQEVTGAEFSKNAKSHTNKNVFFDYDFGG